jgi:hypothetical protein
MRATINFEIDIDKVEETMQALVVQEAANLRHAVTILEQVEHNTLLEEVSEAIDLVQSATFQLQQYRSMVTSFERAKFDTVLPQSAQSPLVNVASDSRPPVVDSPPSLQSAMESIEAFQGFVDKISTQPQEEENVDQSKEG